MRALIQRVKEGTVSVNGEIVGKVGKGMVVLLGVAEADTGQEAALLADKIAQLRIFADEAGKMNRSLIDSGGGALVVSQFTLYASCKKGRRPSFLDAAQPEKAERLYHEFLWLLRDNGIQEVHAGIFGADMDVSLINDGPVTIWLDSEELKTR